MAPQSCQGLAEPTTLSPFRSEQLCRYSSELGAVCQKASDARARVSAKMRPLIRAARIGAEEFRRDRDLKRLLRVVSVPKPGKGMRRLLDIEQSLEETRSTGNATYSITRHVEILAALITEASFLNQKTLI